MARTALADENVLRMALIGYEQEKEKIQAAIADLHARLGTQTTASTVQGDGAPKKRKLSAAARKRIGDATRRRFAAQRKAKGEAARPKRKMSAKGRAAIIRATKKRWAAFRKAKEEKKAVAKSTA